MIFIKYRIDVFNYQYHLALIMDTLGPTKSAQIINMGVAEGPANARPIICYLS